MEQGNACLYVYGIIIIFSGSIVSSLNARCTTSESGLPRFGNQCQYECHCANQSEQCDVITGNCVTGCDFIWAGPGCQFKNIAYGKLSRQESNTQPIFSSELANDNKLSTCSYTSYSNTSAPWWNLWIPEYTAFKQIEFVTKSKHLFHFQDFEVKVYNTTKEDFENKGPMTGGVVCYQNDNTIPGDTKIQVTCVGSPVGNLIRLQLRNETSQLVLCDFKLYEECESGKWGKDCWQNCGNCDNSACDLISGTCPKGCSPGFKGPKCNEQCETGKWGTDCWHNCGNCDNSTCDPINGTCPKGCSAGFKGPKCNELCDVGHYGPKCNMSCSDACFGSSWYRKACNHVDGRCRFCKGGYTGQWCEKECENGKWGNRCLLPCLNCLNSSCNRMDGFCTEGCSAGYKPKRCILECDQGFFGVDCKQRCSQRCSKSRGEICSIVNGTCTNGCVAGYRGAFCEHECEEGKWGLNCQNACGKCLKSPCNHVDGTCKDGCVSGYKPTKECKTVCEPAYFGKDWKQLCIRTCSSSERVICDNVNGTCMNGCFAGHTGTYCEFVPKQIKAGTNEEVTISLGVLCALLLLYAVGITVLFKNKTSRTAHQGRQHNGPTTEANIALTSDTNNEVNPYASLNHQRTEGLTYYDTIQTDSEL